jgi:cytosine/adenosine deaminase-related metal-dependent hydrolase
MVLQQLAAAGTGYTYDIRVSGEKITAVAAAGSLEAGEKETLQVENGLVFPGLINSHDHLDFDLYPLCGNKIYRDYTEWGADIHRHNKETIHAVRSIPLGLRVRWGQYKNLLNGFTTVVHHGRKLEQEEELLSVYQNSYDLHSLATEKWWRWKLNIKAGKQTVALHIGEGTSKKARKEIKQLRRWNFFQRPIVGIHGVAIDGAEAALLKALVWCPGSNYFLLGQTAAIDCIKAYTPVLFGTDSTLTASWNSWQQLRLARATGLLTDAELLYAVTRTPASVWDLPGRGVLEAGARADLVIAQPPAATGMDAFFAVNPGNLSLVMHRGALRLLSEQLYYCLLRKGWSAHLKNFYLVYLQGQPKYVRGNLPQLIKEVKRYLPQHYLPGELAIG